ncbi:MAG: rubredoxin [Firmicutes bacterium]|nr:rubredoxin [Bacillota bacterium]
MENKPAKYVCGACGYVYDPEIGDPANKVAPGTPFEEIEGFYMCPVCGLGKAVFKKEE